MDVGWPSTISYRAGIVLMRQPVVEQICKISCLSFFEREEIASRISSILYRAAIRGIVLRPPTMRTPLMRVPRFFGSSSIAIIGTPLLSGAFFISLIKREPISPAPTIIARLNSWPMRPGRVARRQR